jgi:predicted nucleotidyltransferase
MATTHYPDGDPPGPAELSQALEEVIGALRAADLPFVLMGGVGNAAVARPRSTDDIDVFVRPDDALRALEVLGEAGFATEEHDPYWLYKAFKYGVLVDIIFRSTGDIYLDEEMLERSSEGTYQGKRGPVMAAEDLLVVKAVAAGEATPHHWYDALGIVARCALDWDYVLKRAREAGPRRVLSLLLYAESTDLAVPAEVVEELFAVVHPRSARERAGTPAR